MSEASDSISTMSTVDFFCGINLPAVPGIQSWLYNLMLSPPALLAAEYMESKVSIVSLEPPNEKQKSDIDQLKAQKKEQSLKVAK